MVNSMEKEDIFTIIIKMSMKVNGKKIPGTDKENI
jgi:hypothetical protein